MRTHFKCTKLALLIATALSVGVRIWSSQAAAGPVAPNGDCVVLLHGLGRSAWSMKRLEWRLEKQGFRVVNRSYPSRRESIEALAGEWLPRILADQRVSQARQVHFVGHSMGGIILRRYLETNSLPNLGRVVMLAPPNQGSELVNKFNKWAWFRSFIGTAGRQLGTDTNSLPRRLGPPSYELGIIAGDRSLNPFFSAWLPGPDDGKVSVQNTRLNGAKQHLIVHRTHTWMMWRNDVLNAVASFLKDGHFATRAEGKENRDHPELGSQTVGQLLPDGRRIKNATTERGNVSSVSWEARAKSLWPQASAHAQTRKRPALKAGNGPVKSEGNRARGGNAKVSK